MKEFSTKRTIGSGLALAMPLGVILYVIIKFIGTFETAITPLVKKFDIDTLFGEVTITVFAVLLMLIIVFLLGLMMQFSFVSNIMKNVEEVVLKFIPSLNHLKMMLAEKLDMEHATLNWKPVLVLREEQYIPAFIIEENTEWITLMTTKPPSTEPNDLVIVRKDSIRYREISLKQMQQCNKQFGKGYLALTLSN